MKHRQSDTSLDDYIKEDDVGDDDEFDDGGFDYGDDASYQRVYMWGTGFGFFSNILQLFTYWVVTITKVEFDVLSSQ